MVEKEMRVTLASCLAQAVHDIKQFKDGSIDSTAYMEWCDKYQVCVCVFCKFYFTKLIPLDVSDVITFII